MATKQTIKNIEETFIVGLNGVLKISALNKKLWSNQATKYSIIIALATPIISVVLNIDPYLIIEELEKSMISCLPTILGFTLSGYALVVGFVQSNMLDKITEPTKNSKFSLYQIMSAKFAVNVILQGIALVFAFLIHFMIYLYNNSGTDLHLPELYKYIINLLGLAILSFWFVISILLIIQIALNIFGFSQLHQYIINKNKIDIQDKNQDNGS